MSLDAWDKELELVAKEIATVRASYDKVRLTGNKALIARKVAIIQAQLSLERNLANIKKLTDRDLLLLPREKTLLHWGQIYLDLTRKYFDLKTRLVTRSLWLKLIKTRLTGPEPGATDELEADDLVALAVRQANLAKTERYLADSLTTLRRRKKELTRRYEQLGIAEANRDAAHTLQGRLGLTVEDAMSSPTMQATFAWIRRATAPVSTAGADQRLAASAQQLQEKSAGLIGLCRNLVVAGLRSPETLPSPRALDRFELAMRQLSDLEAKTQVAYEQVLAAAPAAARPILVQKPGKQAKE